MDVPLEPPVELLRFLPWLTWVQRILTPPAFDSAKAEGVFLTEALGPRGGIHFAIRDSKAWTAWARIYRERVQTRLNREAARRLGYAAKRDRR